MAALATVADVEMRLGGTSFNDQALVESLLRAASAIARKEVPSIDGRMTAGTLDADLVTEVVAGMVVRVLRNRVPDEMLSLAEDAPVPDGWDSTVRLTGREKALLAPSSPVRVRSTRLESNLAYPCRQVWL